jgi:hypothetical protein
MSKARDLANAGTALTTVSATELGYLDGVTSAVQTQIDSKIGSASAINPTIVDAKGDIVAATAADTVARLAVGANDTVLTADSTAATGLKWATPVSGGLTQLATGTFSGTSISITSISSSYTDLRLVLLNPYANAASNTMRMTVNSDTGANYDLARYNPSLFQEINSYINLYGNLATTTADYATDVITFRNYANTSVYKIITTENWNQQINSSWQNVWKSTSAISSIQVKLSSTASFSGGTYILYGVK